MNHMLRTLILIIASVGVYSQVPGTWLVDWQSQGAPCAPASFVVTNTSNATNLTYTVNYTFTSVAGCPSAITGNYASNLTLITANVYNDSKNIQLTFDTVHNVVFYLSLQGVNYLYDQNGALLPRQTTLGTIGGFWLNSTFVNSTNGSTQSQCCAPSTVFISPTDANDQDNSITITANFNGACNVTQPIVSVLSINPAATYVEWAGALDKSGFAPNYLFTPNTTQLTAQFVYSNATKVVNTCTYTFQKSTNFTFLNSTWVLDWQSQSSKTASAISVYSVNSTYMLSTLNFSSTLNNSYFVPNGQAPNQYFIPTTGYTYSFDNVSNTLLATVPTTNAQILYSQNGSLLNNNLVESYWNNSQLINNSSANCCLPTLVHITSPSANTYDIEYDLSGNYSNISGCEDLIPDVKNDQLSGALTLNGPSITSLKWSDAFNATVTLNATANQLTVSGFGTGKCQFTMDLDTNPNPKPLSANWMSVGITSLVGFLVVMGFAF